MTIPTETTPQGGSFPGTDPTWRLPTPLRRGLLLIPPLLLAGLEILHPQPDETVQALMDAATWFAGFHVSQLVLTGPVALSVILLADSFGRAEAWVTRLGIGVFTVFFSAYDAVAGIGRGSRCEAHETCRPRNKRVSTTRSRTGRL